MKLDFFDANIFLGRPTKAIYKPVSSGSKLSKELGGFGIKKALVWHIAQHDVSPVEGNRLLAQEIAKQKGFFGCWTILPPQTQEVIGTDFFRKMKNRRIFALRAFPDFHHFLLNRITFGRFLEEVTERRVPLLLSLERGITWPAVYQLLGEFPNLTCILCDIGVWGVDRYTWPLLENYPNVFLETSLLSLEDGATEAAVSCYGAERFIFGTGFPGRYPEASILQLLHAEIPDSAKMKIASANLQRLLSRINL